MDCVKGDMYSKKVNNVLKGGGNELKKITYCADENSWDKGWRMTDYDRQEF